MQARSSGAHHGATLRALQRNAAVVLESIGAVYDNRRSGDYLSCDHSADRQPWTRKRPTRLEHARVAGVAS